MFRQRRASFGVVLIRLPGMNGDARAALVVDALERVQDKIARNFTVIDATGIRIRQP